MLPGDKTILKQVLRDKCLPALSVQWKYYNTEAIKAWLQKRKLRCSPVTLNRYLHEFTRAGLIFSAGRGWHSSLATTFTLDRNPVSSLVQELNESFPLLDFSCWSTAQISSYGHHLLAKFVAFVHTERDSMETVVEALRETGWTAYLHPTRLEATKSFRQSNKTVVVRPAVSRAPVDGKYATIEKILVDLCAEIVALRLLDAGEYQRLVVNLANSERISVATLAEYAKRRNLKVQEVLPGIIN
jgi:hypothetical protein